jgi:hypothetical protein
MMTGTPWEIFQGATQTELRTLPNKSKLNVKCEGKLYH